MSLLPSGRIVVLNGPSSAGKSTTADAFMALMPGPWWHTGMDALSAMLTPDEAKRAMCGVERFVTALHRFVADLARQGHDVVYETGFLEETWVADFRHETAGLRVYAVEFFLSEAVVREREHGRADRPGGYSEASMPRLLRAFPEALRLDAEALEPAERARAITEFIQSPLTPDPSPPEGRGGP